MSPVGCGMSQGQGQGHILCQVILAILPCIGAVSTNENWSINRHSVQCISPISYLWSRSVNWCLVKG